MKRKASQVEFPDLGFDPGLSVASDTAGIGGGRVPDPVGNGARQAQLQQAPPAQAPQEPGFAQRFIETGNALMAQPLANNADLNIGGSVGLRNAMSLMPGMTGSYRPPAFGGLDPTRATMTFFGNQHSTEVMREFARLRGLDLDAILASKDGLAEIASLDKSGKEVKTLVQFLRMSEKPTEFADSIKGTMDAMVPHNPGTVMSVGKQPQFGGRTLFETVAHPDRLVAKNMPEAIVDGVTDGFKELVSRPLKSAGVLGHGERTLAPALTNLDELEKIAPLACDSGHSGCNGIQSAVGAAGHDNNVFAHLSPSGNIQDQADDLSKAFDAMTEQSRQAGPRAAGPSTTVADAPDSALATTGRTFDKTMGVLGMLGGGVQMGNGIYTAATKDAVSGGLDVVGGGANFGAGAAQALGTTVKGLGAGQLAGIGGILGGAKDVYDSYYDPEVAKKGNGGEKRALGAVKGLGGALMLYGGGLAGTGIGGIPGAAFMAAGGLLQGGAALYENREFLKAAGGMAVNGVKAAGGALWDAGKWAGGKAVDGIKAAPGAIYDGVMGLGGKARDAFGWLTGW